MMVASAALAYPRNACHQSTWGPNGLDVLQLISVKMIGSRYLQVGIAAGFCILQVLF